MDLNTLFDAIKKQFAEQLPFVIYRKPSTETINGILQKDDTLHLTSSLKESGFVFAPYDTSLNAVLFPIEKCNVYSGLYQPVENQQKNEEKHNQTPENKTLKQKHIQLIQKGINAIHNGELKKVVLSRSEEIKIKEITDGESVINLFKCLLNKHPSAFVYSWYHPSVGLWLGATPESLFSLESKTFRTMALAATQKYKKEEKVFWTEKEKEEQNMVTQYLETSLENIVPILMITRPSTFRAGNVIHLKTDVGGTINTRVCDIPCLTKRLHPTPAVCGLPKNNATQFIQSTEDYDREFYTGFLGELNINKEVFENKQNTKQNYADFYVNLRCMKIKKNIATVFVGGGITKDSNPEAEWEETVHKAEAMMQILS